MAKRMTSMNVSMPASMRKWVETRMESEGFANASEYFRHLVRQDAVTIKHLRKLIREGEKSGPVEPFTDSDWKHIRARLKAARGSRSRKSA